MSDNLKEIKCEMPRHRMGNSAIAIGRYQVYDDYGNAAMTRPAWLCLECVNYAKNECGMRVVQE